MSTEILVLIAYFIVGFILGVIAVNKYRNLMGSSSAAPIMLACCTVAWPLVFPDMMIDLAKEKDRLKSEGKFILTEEEEYAPDYTYRETFDSLEEAQERMKEMYSGYFQNPAVEKAEIFDLSARVCINDGNEIRWNIEKN